MMNNTCTELMGKLETQLKETWDNFNFWGISNQLMDQIERTDALERELVDFLVPDGDPEAVEEVITKINSYEFAVQDQLANQSLAERYEGLAKENPDEAEQYMEQANMYHRMKDAAAEKASARRNDLLSGFGNVEVQGQSATDATPAPPHGAHL